MKSITSICLHHKIMYTTRFVAYLLAKQRSNKCSNPLGIHLPKKQPNVSCSKSITLNLCEKIASKNGAIHVYPGQQLCVTCYKQLLHISNELEVKSTRESSSKLGDLETALEDIVSDDAFSSPLTSPEKDLRRSTLITNTLNFTPITIAAKRSKGRRNPDIGESGA
ncbi:Cc8L18.2-like protein, partial [Daphnia magna]